MTSTLGLTAEQVQALDIARQLVAAGVPVFAAPPNSTRPGEFLLPKGWPDWRPNPAAVDQWRPGWALAAVCGHTVDVLDTDPRNGGDVSAASLREAGLWPQTYGRAATPSGGTHDLIAPVRIAKCEAAPGVDLQSGRPDGTGRGFVYIAPTVRVSKVDGESRPYRWLTEPDLAKLAESVDDDDSGVALAAVVVESKRAKSSPAVGASMFNAPASDRPAADSEAVRARVNDLAAELGRAPEGSGNNEATRIGYMVGGYVGAGQIGLDEAVSRLHGALAGWTWRDNTSRDSLYFSLQRAVEDGARQPRPWTAARPGHGLRQAVANLLGNATPTDPPSDDPSAQARHAGAGLTDSLLAEAIATDVLDGRYLWCRGLGWLAWDGRRWDRCSDETVGEPVRQWAVRTFAKTAKTGNEKLIDLMRPILSLGKQRAAVSLAKGILECRPADLDAHPDLLNTPAGVVDLRTGTLSPHDPALRLTKLTAGSYRPGYTHPDWEQALTALPADVRGWWQVRIGQAITGHPTPDGIMPVLQGGGENGKSLLTTDGAVPALGDYASMASAKLFTAGKGSDHSTERADLRGRRLLIAEELSEGRSIDVAALKQIQDVGRIRARYIRQDNIEFDASHSLFTTTNYVPVVAETDHGTWRRLALVRFPYTFRANPADVRGPDDRAGDPHLKARIRAGSDGQHDAIVTWAVTGALLWHLLGADALRPPPRVAADTRAWRGDADRILGFWTERIIADPNRCVLATELLDAFNDWLRDNGHNAWAKETFTPRFEQHSETRSRRVEQRRTRQLDGLSRYSGQMLAGALEPPPTVARVWLGVRFRTSDDLREDESRAECVDPLALPHAHKDSAGNAEGSTHSARPPQVTRQTPTLADLSAAVTFSPPADAESHNVAAFKDAPADAADATTTPHAWWLARRSGEHGDLCRDCRAAPGGPDHQPIGAATRRAPAPVPASRPQTHVRARQEDQ